MNEPIDPCSEVLGHIYDYLSGELTEHVRITIRSHLDDCGPCLDVHDFEMELRTVIATRCRDRVPDDLRRRIADELGLA